MIDFGILKNDEHAVLKLRALYKMHGYLPFKMSKFEEYDLYVRNKEFLVGDGVIAFNDTDGRLLAMKPDVTLSIIKNTKDEPGCKERVYYNENVYRVSPKTHRFKEIMQAGLECIGDVDSYDIFEVVYLAAKSLAEVSEDFILDISDMGILSGVVALGVSDETLKRKLLKLIADKNKHEALELMTRENVAPEDLERILSLTDMHGNMEVVLKRLEAICVSPELGERFDELSRLVSLLSKTELKDRIRIDFSVVNDMDYYNGIVFKGYLMGIGEGVLSGGEYGMLMQNMGRKSRAVGFALYLDLLEELSVSVSDADVDVLLLYSEKSDMGALIAMKNEIIKGGESVSLQKSLPEKIRYKRLVDFDKR